MEPTTMFPATWTWTALQTNISEFLANGMVTGAVLFALGLILAPSAVIAIKRAVRRG